ncbi:anti-sigma-factor antagonist [Desulfovibrio sp. X2]|uniref:STAS domain-containing protein n=1 Tax=Desulfovibrio sp. X2 TaxID=941449 RepID=UPI00035894BA|nr:STAS domain-containing protein [Desulfovibrio sp. X2]EPR43961.1 anti-sigma-factor antagonist [Desulfovibrio sp. X2]
MSINLHVTEHDNCIVARPETKDLRFDVSNEFKQALVELIEARPDHLVIDISDIEFVDSTALSAFIAAKSRLAAKGKTLVLFGQSKAVTGVLRLTSLDKFLNLMPDLDAALASLAAPA